MKKKILLIILIVFFALIIFFAFYFKKNSNPLDGISVTLKFDTGTDEQIDDIDVELGSEVALPTPNRDGYVFSGWLNNDEVYFDNYTAYSDETFTAFWIENTDNSVYYKVIFDTNDGDTKTMQYNIKADTLLELPPEPTKEGYKFLGWYYNNEKIENGTLALKSDVTLIAKWDKE